jgi:hypothetical protein
MKTTIEGECDRQWSARVSVNAWHCEWQLGEGGQQEPKGKHLPINQFAPGEDSSFVSTDAVRKHIEEISSGLFLFLRERGATPKLGQF